MSLSKIKTSALCALLFASAAALAIEDASAEVRTRQTTVSNSQGKTATGVRTVNRGDQSRQTTNSVQTSSGKGFTRSTNAGYDAETGAYKNRSVTTNSGETLSRNTSANCANGVCSTSTTATGTNGQTASRGTVRYADENGDYVKSSEITGANGQTATRDVNRTGDGQKTTTVTNADGESRSRTRWITVE